MAGSHPSFSPERFRNAIRFVADMAAPEKSNERVIFRWEADRTYGSADPSGNPYKWDAAPESQTAQQDVTVDCVVEFAARPNATLDTTMGQFDPSRATITVLDEDIESVRGATTAIIMGNEYKINFVGPAIGLFEVTLYQFYAEARDLSINPRE